MSSEGLSSKLKFCQPGHIILKTSLHTADPEYFVSVSVSVSTAGRCTVRVITVLHCYSLNDEVSYPNLSGRGGHRHGTLVRTQSPGEKVRAVSLQIILTWTIMDAQQ